MASLTLSFEAPNTPLSINKANRMHWAAKKRLLDPWRDSTAMAWWEARNLWGEVKGKPCTVEVHLPFRTAQRRDPHNYSSTTIKAIIDSLVRQNVWPDDTPEWVTVIDSVIEVGTTTCRIVLTTR